MGRGRCHRHGPSFGPCSCSLGKLSRLVEPTILYMLATERANYGYELMEAAAEEINRAILDLPITVLDSLGMENTANEVKRVQDSSIGAIYQLVHDINHKVADLATELLEQREGKEKQ